jgi:hypothetical protein
MFSVNPGDAGKMLADYKYKSHQETLGLGNTARKGGWIFSSPEKPPAALAPLPLQKPSQNLFSVFGSYMLGKHTFTKIDLLKMELKMSIIYK